MTPVKRLGTTEFVALTAMLYASVAFSVDAMLPALPDIAAELSPADPNRAQLILTSFVFGMGAGTFIMGAVSDALGRKPVILGSAVIFVIGALLAWAAQSLELMLAARALQGFGAAAPRVVSMAIVRDLYSGRQMARIVSIAMMVFMLFPAVAPLIGAFIIAGFGWRAIFAVFILFALTTTAWLGIRQPETHPPEARRPLRPAKLWEAAREVLSHRVIVIAITVLTLTQAGLFATISSVQQIFDETFGRAESFPVWFATMAIIAASGSLLNATIIVRVGMRRVIVATLAFQFAAAFGFTLVTWAGLWPPGTYFWGYFVWHTCFLLSIGLVFGNVNALALEPVGHIAGMAASMISATATVLSVLIAAPIGLAFDGTPVPLALGVSICCGIAWLLMRTVPRESGMPKRRL